MPLGALLYPCICWRYAYSRPEQVISIRRASALICLTCQFTYMQIHKWQDGISWLPLPGFAWLQIDEAHDSANGCEGPMQSLTMR